MLHTCGRAPDARLALTLPAPGRRATNRGTGKRRGGKRSRQQIHWGGGAGVEGEGSVERAGQGRVPGGVSFSNQDGKPFSNHDILWLANLALRNKK
jgi:hypothetical protein